VLARRVQHPVAERAHVARRLEVLRRAHCPPTLHGADCSLEPCARTSARSIPVCRRRRLRMNRWVRSFDPQLPRTVWLLQLGGVMNSFGNGVVLPFLVIYLHDVRGFGLGVSGLVVATSAAAQVTAGILAGPLVDRLGPRPVLAGGLTMQAVGFGLFPLVHQP